ncbi:mannitol-1-phosphate 5-dehydrogenase [Agrococcus casei]|uniref:mannitol-1-phosphate 5-dehydrogenase n=1 Tax=Agrococcus casei TaxID=343512 RepID=UPI003F8F1B5B
MRAVHFGAGNIGRGFVGVILHRAGFHVTFVDVNAELIDAINAHDSYVVHEVGDHGDDITVTGFDAINSQADPEAAVRAVAEADIVTCAVGPNVMKFIAPVIRKGLEARAPEAARLTVMAVENAIGATDQLREHVVEGAPGVADRAVFANTAVDRIVPGQDPSGIDVTVEDFFEWAIDRTPFAGDEPRIPDAHYVDDLQPYIERKLFTVNTGHATTAYFGYRAGIETIAEALERPEILAAVEAALQETSKLIVDRFGFDPDEHAQYAARAIQRFRNPALPDTCVRIGRQPLRKLGREDRFVRPAAELAERGAETDALVAAYGAALAFDASDDEQAAELQQLLRDLSPAEFVTQVSGIEQGHPLFDTLTAAVATR